MIRKYIIVATDEDAKAIQHTVNERLMESLRERDRMEGRAPYPERVDPEKVQSIQLVVEFKA